MSFDKKKVSVEEGDTVVLYLGRQSLIFLEIDTSKTHQTKFGAFPHRNFVGKKYGTKVYSTKGKGWVYLLHPNPELWTVTLPHRTQILYSTDISMITFELELTPGSIVVEAGTGSGSLSHAIIRTIKPNGHLFTFDFHENRVFKAKEEFTKHYGSSDYVTTAQADVCADGFSLTDKADAVFLDLPAPWDAIPHARTALKKSGGRICTFSPCIEQVERSCNALRKAQFCEIKTIEGLLRPMNVTTVGIADMTFDSDRELNHAKGFEIKKQKLDIDRETEGTCENRNTFHNINCGNDAKCPERNGTESLIDTTDCSEVGEKTVLHAAPNSVKVTDKSDGNISTDKIMPNSAEQERECGSVTGLNLFNMVTKISAKSKKGNVNVLTCTPRKEMAGHTGYLTFASLYPFYVDDNMDT